MTPDRPSRDDYYMQLARDAAGRGTCLRAKVGALLVKDDAIISTGYNGAGRGEPHCTDDGVGCFLIDAHCARTIHAELNAVLLAAKRGISVDGATLYVTHQPCFRCAQYLRQSGITDFKWDKPYADREDHPLRERS